MKKRILLLVAVLLVSISFVACQSSDKKTEDSKAVVIVNKESISETEFNDYVNYQKKVAEITGYVAPDMWSQEIRDGQTYESALKESVIEEMVNNLLVLQDAKKREVLLEDSVVKEEMEKYKSTEELQKEFDTQLEKLEITEDYLKNKILYPNLLINKYFQETVEVTDEEAKNYYDEYSLTFDKVKASHILVDSEDKARAIKKKLDEDGNFQELAKEYSTCPSKDKGGDLGYFGRGRMDPAFEKAAFELEIGEISDVVQSQFGFHIIKLEDKSLTYETNKADVVSKLRTDKIRTRLDELKNDSEIEYKITFTKEVQKDEESTETSEKETEETIEEE
jgi:parvulin-like peptidyl-prolyl isomerase